MAISRGSGTKIIRSAHFEGVTSTASPMIYGVRHHIYTVLSVICFAEGLQASGNYVRMYLTGYDSDDGAPQEPVYIFKQGMTVDSTFVWNDPFSFNGYEPVDFAGPLDSEAKQDAIADQLVSGDSNRLILYIQAENASDNFDVHISYLDYNNA